MFEHSSEGESCADLGRVLVLNDPPASFTLKVCHAPISVECLLSITHLPE